jgi:abhydrolase domain-containing protein 14
VRRPRVAPRPGRARALLGALALAVAAIGTGCGSDDAPVAGETTIQTGGVAVHAIVREPIDPDPAATDDAEPLTVLLLHGAAYTSRIWDDRGILDAVAAEGHRAVAVDLPGSGDTPARSTAEGTAVSDGTWLKGLIDELGGPERVVLVSPSMSGSWSLPYLAIHADDALAGFVPIAPVGADDLLRPADAAPVPALVVHGADDEAYTAGRAQGLLDQLRGEPGRVEVIADGSHAAYDDEPEAFLAALRAFLDELDA